MWILEFDEEIGQWWRGKNQSQSQKHHHPNEKQGLPNSGLHFITNTINNSFDIYGFFFIFPQQRTGFVSTPEEERM